MHQCGGDIELTSNGSAKVFSARKVFVSLFSNVAEGKGFADRLTEFCAQFEFISEKKLRALELIVVRVKNITEKSLCENRLLFSLTGEKLFIPYIDVLHNRS